MGLELLNLGRAVSGCQKALTDLKSTQTFTFHIPPNYTLPQWLHFIEIHRPQLTVPSTSIAHSITPYGLEPVKGLVSLSVHGHSPQVRSFPSQEIKSISSL